jgi:hypothetical protein
VGKVSNEAQLTARVPKPLLQEFRSYCQGKGLVQEFALTEAVTDWLQKRKTLDIAIAAQTQSECVAL